MTLITTAGRRSEDMDRGRTTKKRSRMRRGVAAVEFAVVAPVLFLTIFGMIEMGRMVMVKQAVVNAAREGCREAILATTIDIANVDALVRARLANVVPNSADVNELRVTCYVTPDLPFTTEADLTLIASGDTISVTVECDFSDVSWVPGNFVGLPNTVISATTTKERE